ncbi:phosphopantetheine-binding protein [Kineococcus sp. TBRC 1896]|uniref:Phosphopantetheine-binding protein n=1 Tax=Kineococcus mangrovi TaxID=1660183 RepID=A0ABV4I099_9ACTN
MTDGTGTHEVDAARLRTDVAEILGLDPAELTEDEDLFDRGMDSVRLMALLGRWRAAGVGDLEFADLAEQPELRHWARLVTSTWTR